MDDIMRAVFGQSVHEDSVDIPPENRIRPVSAVEYLVPGDMRLDDLNPLLDLDLDSEDFDTLGGWLLDRFGVLPEVGETYSLDGVLYKVEEQSQRRIQTVRITLPVPLR